LTPLYILKFQRYPVGEAQSLKDFTPNLAAFKGMYYFNPSLPFHRVRGSFQSVEAAKFALKCFRMGSVYDFATYWFASITIMPIRNII
jgi:hypothetical protein